MKDLENDPMWQVRLSPSSEIRVAGRMAAKPRSAYVSSRNNVASRDALATLVSSSYNRIDILTIWIDGIVVSDHRIPAAVGVDAEGEKHLLGLKQEASKNVHVAKP